MIRFNDEPVRFGDGEKAELDALLAQADRKIREKNGEGNDFLGWIDLPDNYDREELKRIQAAGDRIAESSDVLIVIGIGGSYLGAKAALEFPLLQQHRQPQKGQTGDIFPRKFVFGRGDRGCSRSLRG